MEREKSEKGEERIKIKNSEIKEGRYKDIKHLFETYERRRKGFRRKILFSSILLVIGLYSLIFLIVLRLVPNLNNMLIRFLGENITRILFYYLPLPLFLIGGISYLKLGAPWKWGNFEQRLLFYSYGTFYYRFEKKSKKYLLNFIDELEGELEYAKEMLFFDKNKEKKIKVIIDTLRRYILPNLGNEKNFDNKNKIKVIKLFEDFSLEIFGRIQGKNDKTDFLNLLAKINEGRKFFTEEKPQKSIWGKISSTFSEIKLSKIIERTIPFIAWIGLLIISAKFEKWEILASISSFGFIYYLLKDMLKR